jgi:hypothetical protein
MENIPLMGFRRKFFKILLALVLSILPVMNLFAGDSVRPVNKDKGNIAIKGYDAVLLRHRINDYGLKVSITVFRSGPFPKAFLSGQKITIQDPKSSILETIGNKLFLETFTSLTFKKGVYYSREWTMRIRLHFFE